MKRLFLLLLCWPLLAFGTTTFLTKFTVTPNGNQTNVPMTFGLPLAQNIITSGSPGCIQMVDDLTSTAIPIQEDGRSSDLAGNVHQTDPTAILPTLVGTTPRVYSINAVSGCSPSSGTDITTSDIAAVLNGVGSADYLVTITDHTTGGAGACIYTASLHAALSASTWTNTNTAANLGTWRHGGGYATEYVLFSPLSLSGVNAGCAAIQGSIGGANTDQLYVQFDVLAFKNSTGAVSGGNPITAIRVNRVIGSGYVQKANTVVSDDYYDLSETFGSTTISFPTTQPTQNATLGSASYPGNGSANTTITASSSLFGSSAATSTAMGQLVSDGTGYGVISGWTSSTVAKINIFKTFAGTSLTGGGGWTMYGIAHVYGTRYRKELWYSGLQVPAYTANIGTAWTGSSGGPSTYLFGTGMMLPYAASVSDVGANVMTNFQNAGTNPQGYTATQIAGGQAGDINMDVGSTGERAEIGVMPDWVIRAMLYADTNGFYVGPYATLNTVIGNGDKANLIPFQFNDPSTGKTMVLNSGLDWYNEGCGGQAWGSQWIAQPCMRGAQISINNWAIQTAHMGDFFYAPYVLTGDWYWLDGVQKEAFYVWSANNSGYSGTQLYRQVITEDDEQRGCSWNFRSVSEAASVTPDSSYTTLGLAQAQLRTYLENNYTVWGGGGYGVAPWPGSNASLVCDMTSGLDPLCSGWTDAQGNARSGSTGNRFAASGPRFAGTLGGSGQVFSQWMAGYYIHSLFHAKEAGMMSTNGLAFLNWLAEGLTSAALDTTDAVPAYTVTAYWMDAIYPTGTNLNTWSSVYKATAGDPINSYGNQRQLSGTMTISGKQGIITSTFPSGTFLNGGTAFYAGGWVHTTSDSGYGYIASVSGDTVTFATPAYPVTFTNRVSYSSNHTVTVGEWGDPSYFSLGGSSITITIPQSSTLSSGGSLVVSTAGATPPTLAPFATDHIFLNGADQGAGVSLTLGTNAKYYLTTNSSGSVFIVGAAIAISTNHTVTSGEWANSSTYANTGTSVTLTLPQSSTLSSTNAIYVHPNSTKGMTLTPYTSDVLVVNGTSLSAGTSTTLLASTTYSMTTDAAGNLYVDGGSTTHDTGITDALPFLSSSYVTTLYNLPWPAVGDNIGVEKTTYYATPGGQGSDYWDIAKGAHLLLAHDSYPSEPAACAAVFGLGASTWSNTWKIKWDVSPGGITVCPSASNNVIPLSFSVAQVNQKWLDMVMNDYNYKNIAGMK